MNTIGELTREDLSDCVLPSQYNDLFGRRSVYRDGEYRLLFAILEDAIKTYLANKRCANPAQKKRFEETRGWFESARESNAGLFGFQSICELLEIEPARLLESLKSFEPSPLSVRRHRIKRDTEVRNLAA
jgi:hypothetical protein